MIIWSGWGILVVPLVAVTVGLFAFATGAARLNGPGASRTLVDPETGGTVLLQRRHSLFFIPVRYWAVPCIILSGLLLFVPIAAAK